MKSKIKDQEVIRDCQRAINSYQEKIENLWEEMVWELSMKHRVDEDKMRELLGEI